MKIKYVFIYDFNSNLIRTGLHRIIKSIIPNLNGLCAF